MCNKTSVTEIRNLHCNIKAVQAKMQSMLADGQRVIGHNAGLLQCREDRKCLARLFEIYEPSNKTDAAYNVLKYGYDLELAEYVNQYVRALIEFWYNTAKTSIKPVKGLWCFLDMKDAGLESIVVKLCKKGIGTDITQYKIKTATVFMQKGNDARVLTICLQHKKLKHTIHIH